MGAPINTSPEIGEFCFPAPSNENVNSPNSTKDDSNGKKLLPDLPQYLNQFSITSSSIHSIQESEEEEEQDTDHDCERNAHVNRGFNPNCLISRVHHSGATIIEIPEEEEDEILNDTEKPIEIGGLGGKPLESTNDFDFYDSDQETIVPTPTVSTKPDI